MDKQTIFNSIFLRRRRKIVVSEKINLNYLFKTNLENSIKNDKFLSTNTQYNIVVKDCNYLKCIIDVGNAELEFENGELESSTNTINNEDLINKIKTIVEKEILPIKNKLNMALTLNQNISSLGFCMDLDLLNYIAVYNEKKIKEFSDFLIPELKKLVGDDVEYISLFPNFPQQVIKLSLFDVHFYRWLYYINLAKTGENCIPCKFEKMERVKKDINDLTLKVISIGKEDEFNKMITNIMNSAEAMSPQDLMDINNFMEKEERHLEFIPETINNKENLANISNIIIKYHKASSLEILQHKFKNVNDVLRLALVISGNNASDVGKAVRFKSFSNFERRLFMGLLNNCNNRCEDFMKYKNIWTRFCEKVHPNKYKNTYPDLVNDLLGDYYYKRNIKKYRVEHKYYKALYEFNEQSYFKIEKAKDDFNKKIISTKRYKKIMNEIKDDYQHLLKQFENVKKNLKNLSEEKDHATGWLSKMCEIKNVVTYPFDKNMINVKLESLEKEMYTCNEFIRNYRRENQTFNSKVVELINNNNIDECAILLSQRPGIFLRHLDELITKGDNNDKILELFENIGSKASVKVLLSVKGFFQKRYNKLKRRAFLIKGSTGKKKVKLNNNNNNKNNNKQRRNQKVKPATVIYYTDKVKEPLKFDLCEKIINICDKALIINFENKSKLNGVYISPDLHKILIPQDLRGSNSGLENFTKGSKFNLSFKNITEEEKEKMINDAEKELEKENSNKNILLNKKQEIEQCISSIMVNEASSEKIEMKTKELNSVIENLKVKETTIKNLEKDLENTKKCPIGENYNKVRLFIWWTNAKNNRGNIIDISVLVFDETFNVKTKVAWNHLKDGNYNIYHSGDFIDGGDEEGKGVSEFIDLDIEKILAQGGRYVVIGVISYSGPNLKEFKNCKFGWMERQDLNSNEFYEPSTVRQRIDVQFEGKAGCPAILDCKTRELIWIDTLLAKEGYSLCIEYLINNIKALLYYYMDPMRLSLAELFKLHVEARNGILIESEEELKEGDTAFVPVMPYSKKPNVKYIASTDLDIILSEYMTSEKEK